MLFKKKVKIEEEPREIKEYETFKLVTGTRRIKSVVLQLGVDGGIYGSFRRSSTGSFAGFGGNYSGTTKGSIVNTPYYYVYEIQDDGSYLLQKYKAEEIYIEEVNKSEEHPSIANVTRFVLIDKEDATKGTEMYIDGELCRYSEPCDDLYAVDGNIRYAHILENDISDTSIMHELIGYGFDSDKRIFAVLDKTSIKIPQNSEWSGFNISLK